MRSYTYDERGLCIEEGVCVDVDLRKHNKYYKKIYGPIENLAFAFPEDIKNINIVGAGSNFPFGIIDVMEVYDTIEAIDPESFTFYAEINEFRVKDHITGEYIIKKKFGNGNKMLKDYSSWFNFCYNIKENVKKAKKTSASSKKATSAEKKTTKAKVSEANVDDPLKDFVENKFAAAKIPDNIARLKVEKVHSKAGTLEYSPAAVKFVLSEYFNVWKKVSSVQHGTMGDTTVLEKDLFDINEVPDAEKVVELLNKDEFIDFLKSRIEGNFYRLVIIPFVKYAKDSDIVALTSTIAIKKKGNAKDKIWAETMSHAITGRLKKASENAMSGSETSGKTKTELTEELLKSYYSGHVIKGQDWLVNYMKKTELKEFAETLVWFDMHDKTFILKNGEIINSSGTKYVPYGDIKIAAVVEMDGSDIEQWKAYFNKEKIKQPFEQINEKANDLSNLRKLEDMFNGQTITDKQRNTLRKNLKELFIEYEVDDSVKEFDYRAGKYVFSNRNTMHLGNCVDIDYISNGDKTITFERVHIVSRNARVLNRIISELKDL